MIPADLDSYLLALATPNPARWRLVTVCRAEGIDVNDLAARCGKTFAEMTADECDRIADRVLDAAARKGRAA